MRIGPDRGVILRVLAHAVQLAQVGGQRFVLDDEYLAHTVDDRAVVTRPVVVETQQSPAPGRNAHQPERHALADGRKVQHAAVRGEERKVVLAHEAADFPGRILSVGKQIVEFSRLLRGKPPVNFLLDLLLHRTAVGGEDGVILLKSLDRKGIITNNAERIEHLPQARSVPAARRSHRVNQLIGDKPPRRKDFPDGLLRFGGHLERRLEMGLDDKLLHPDRRSFFAELAQDFDQFVVHAHRQVGRQARTESHALQLGIFLAVGTFGVGPALAAGHAVNRFEDVAKRFVLAHQGVASRDEDIAQLGVLLEIVHQAAQFVVPTLLRAQGFEFEIEAFALEIVHPLTRSAQSAASAAHRIGNQDRHLRIPAVDIVPVGQQPPGGIGFSGLDDILAFPGADLSVGLDQLRRIEDVAADGGIVVAVARHIEQRKVVGCGKEGHSLLAGFREQVHRLRRERIAQEAVQLRGAFHSHGQLEAEIAPPVGNLPVFLFVGHAAGKQEARRSFRLAVLDLLDQQVEHPLAVVGADGLHRFVLSRGPAFGAAAHALRRRERNPGSFQQAEKVIQVDEQISGHLGIFEFPCKELPQQRKRLHFHLPVGG